MDKNSIMDIVMGLIRHTLTTAGGALVTQGVVSSTDLNTDVGAVMVVLGAAWSIYQKFSAKKVVK